MNSSTPKKPESENRHVVQSTADAQQKQKLMILVILAFTIVILTWVATWRWSYNIEGPKASDIFNQAREEISPGIQKFEETKNFYNTSEPTAETTTADLLNTNQ